MLVTACVVLILVLWAAALIFALSARDREGFFCPQCDCWHCRCMKRYAAS